MKPPARANCWGKVPHNRDGVKTARDLPMTNQPAGVSVIIVTDGDIEGKIVVSRQPYWLKKLRRIDR